MHVDSMDSVSLGADAVGALTISSILGSEL